MLGPEWGSGGPGFESRRPDQFPPMFSHDPLEGLLGAVRLGVR